MKRILLFAFLTFPLMANAQFKWGKLVNFESTAGVLRQMILDEPQGFSLEYKGIDEEGQECTMKFRNDTRQYRNQLRDGFIWIDATVDTWSSRSAYFHKTQPVETHDDGQTYVLHGRGFSWRGQGFQYYLTVDGQTKAPIMLVEQENGFTLDIHRSGTVYRTCYFNKNK